jgi:serine/threonine-protein kinase
VAVASDAFVVDDRYEVGDVLGRGGMGEVRRARDLRLDRDVAVKFLRADLAADPEARRRFEEEALNAARLNHPNVVIVLDSGEHEGVPYLVMECLPGRTLRDELRDGSLTETRATWIGRDVLAGLAAAHDAGVIHRDVSPSNILLTDTGRAKLADFGIAKAVEDASVTISGQVVGTPGYLAPERLRGEPATPASDMFAVGVTLKRALGNTAPSDPELAAALDRMTDPDPEHRPTAMAALDVLERGGDVEAETAAVPVVTQTVAVPIATQVVEAVPVVSRRDRLAMFATIAIALLVGALLLLATNHSGQAPAESQESTPPRPTVTVPAPTTIAEPAPTVRAKAPVATAPASKKHGGKGRHERR